MCATTTRYWDCSRPTCSFNSSSCDPGCTDCCANCSGDPDGVHNSPFNQLFLENNMIYGTVAASGSFGLTTNGGPPCGRCYELEITAQCGNPYVCGPNGCNNDNNDDAAGQKLTVMVTNLCPDWQPNVTCCEGCTGCSTCGAGCPPIEGNQNIRGATRHFDIAVPGGGQGLQGKCPNQFTWNPTNINDCTNTEILPSIYASGCQIYYNQLKGMDNPMVAFKEIACPNTTPFLQLNCKK